MQTTQSAVGHALPGGYRRTGSNRVRLTEPVSMPGLAARVPVPEAPPTYVPTPSSARPAVALEMRRATAEQPVAFRNTLEQSYAVGIGGPHRRKTAQSFAASYAAVPASIPMPLGEDETLKIQLKPLPKNVENVADDPSLHNPLARLERLGTGWFGVVVEFEGGVVEDTSDVHSKAWVQLADDEGKSRPLQFALKRAEGMKNDQVVQEVLCWSRNPMEVRRLCARKEEIYAKLIGNHKPPVVPGVPIFLETLVKHNVPAGVVSAAPEARMKPALEATGLEHVFQSVVSGDDVYRGRPDPETYLYAAQQLGRPSVRCVVIGNSNQSVEAARECGMRAVVVAGRKPLYEMGAADLVVRGLDELSFVNLKQLFSNEEGVEGNSEDGEPQPEPELEEDFSSDYWL